VTWRDRAACFLDLRDLDFLAIANEKIQKPLLEVCACCTVREECLQYALDNNETLGIWGGTTPAQRLRILKRRSEGWPGNMHD
jgi:WhiB family redox-sensing transcriptional regulator